MHRIIYIIPVYMYIFIFRPFVGLVPIPIAWCQTEPVSIGTIFGNIIFSAQLKNDKH